MAKFTDLPSLGQSLTGSEIAAIVANVSSTLTTVQLPLSTIKTFVLNGTSTTASNLASGGANQLAYQTAASTTGFVAAPVTTGTALIWNGTSLTWGSPNATATTLTGLLKGNGTVISAATSGTDYAPGTSALATGIVKSTTTTGALTIAVAGTDYQSPIGTISGMVKGNGANALTAAVAGTDYVSPGGLTTALTSYVTSSTLTSTLTSYVTSSTLTSTLTSYATTSSLSSYLTTSTASTTYAPLSGPTFTGSVIGFAATATTSSTASSIGYLGMPQNSVSSAYPIVIGDAGKHIYVTATCTVTIPANSSVAFPIGTTIAFIAAAGATVTIAITTDTMYLGGTGTTGSRTLAAYGMATAVKVTSTSWFINGTGLT